MAAKKKPTTTTTTTQPAKKKPATGSQQPSSDLANLMSSLGITPDQLSAMSGGYADTQDPPVYIGTTDSHGKKRRDNPVVKTSYAYLAPYRWKAADLHAFQQRMFDAGLYGDMKITDMRWGIVDPSTQRAWQQLVDTSAAYYAAGKKIRPQDVLDQMGYAPPPAGPESQKPTNILDVKALGHQAAVDVLGQKLTPEQEGKFVGDFRSMEAPVLAGTNAQQAPDAQEFAKQRVRALDPVRADSRKAVTAFDQIAQLMRGGA
jgi:hypothetical protein